jgi:hypothetical protein
VKIRRIKCDEAKPACTRCVSTGRKCDGYGKVQKQNTENGALQIQVQIRKKSSDWPNQPLQPAIYVGFPGGQQERRIFHRFRDRTVPAFTGYAHSQFWESLVLRVGQQEPAVYHAIVALGAIHEEYQVHGAVWNGSSIQKPLYRQALQQYSSALRQLNDRLQQKSYSNVEIVLISCILFICFEILQGNAMAALSHFEGGMSVLQDLVARSQSNGNTRASIISTGELYELYHVFSRYDVQACSFQGTRSTQLAIPLSGRSMSNLFEAQCYVFALFSVMYRFVREDARTYKYANANEVPGHLLTRREHLLESFKHWSTSLDRFAEEDEKCQPLSISDRKSMIILKAQEKVAVISLKTSLASPGEINFDTFQSEFDDIVNLANSLAEVNKEFNEPWNHFTMELGIVQPLYYAASKCRHRSTRRRAVKALKAAGTEGIWEGPIIGIIAERVMQLEEKGLGPEDIVPENARFHTVDLNIEHEIRQVSMKASRPKDGDFQDWETVEETIRF